MTFSDLGSLGVSTSTSSPLINSDEEYFNNFKLKTFLDGGQGWITDPQKSGTLYYFPNQYSLASSGLGFNFHIKKLFIAAFDVGFPLINFDDKSDLKNIKHVIKAGDPRIDFSVATEF